MTTTADAPALSYSSAPGGWVLVITVLGSGIAALDATVVHIALPTIGRDFHTTGAMVIGANLSGARLTGADLNEALWPPESDVPEGWQLDTNLGRLKLADHASGTVTPS